MNFVTPLALLPLEALLVIAIPLQQNADISVLRRRIRSADGLIGCEDMTSFAGEMKYISDGSPKTCGLYIIAQPDQNVEIEFRNLNVKCETDGVVAVLDGWELQGQLFPDVSDHPLSMEERYTSFCNKLPRKTFVSSQNVALVMFKIPTVKEGFTIFVDFKKNLQPCNAVAMFEQGVYTMKNYGERRNCTTSIIYPEHIHVLNVDVGVSSDKAPFEAEIGLTDKCMNLAGGDYVQVLNGNGLDTAMMTTKGLFCGLDSSESSAKFILTCQHSVVRMVSSGEYQNTVTFQYAPPQEDELQSRDARC